MRTQKNQGILWTSLEAEAVTGGRATSVWHATGVSLNLNHIEPGDLFFASGRDDLEAVFQKGAVAAVVPHTIPVEDHWSVLSVPDVFEALYALARAARYKTQACVVAVQGKQMRNQTAQLLSKTGEVHLGGRHLSLGLAGLPENPDYGVFGLSPLVQPDIAVIADCKEAHRDTLFEAMPPHGAVVLNMDDPGFLEGLARAKAGSIRHIVTYGRNRSADIRILSDMSANSDRYLSMEVSGKTFRVEGIPEATSACAVAAAMAVLQISGKSLDGILDPHGASSSHAVFRIRNMVEYGRGRQTAVLDPVVSKQHRNAALPRSGLSMPRRVETLDFVFSPRRTVETVTDPQAAIQDQYRTDAQQIVPSVLVPGDFVVFQKLWNASRAVFSDTLRLASPGKV